MVKLRLKRFGHTHRPFYRIAAFDIRSPRDGRAVDEHLGTYDPLEADDDKKVTLNRERINHWLDCGAQPSSAVANILKKNGIYFEFKGRSRRRRHQRLKRKAKAQTQG